MSVLRWHVSTFTILYTTAFLLFLIDHSQGPPTKSSNYIARQCTYGANVNGANWMNFRVGPKEIS